MKSNDIGSLGEKLVSSYFHEIGHKVALSKDPYDDRQDLFIDGENCEVKTQTLYRRFPYNNGFEPAFTINIVEDYKIHTNQLSKCMNVKRLFFVSRSSLYFPYVKIYEANSIGNRHFTIIKNKRDGRFVAGFLVSNLNEIVTIERKDIVQLFMDDYNETSF